MSERVSDRTPAKVSDGDKKQRVGMVSLGCAKNLVDSEIMLGELRKQGYEITADATEADTVIVNTCGFIGEAREESIDAILEMSELKQSGGPQKLLVAGCMVNRHGPELAESLPEVDGFVGLDDLKSVDEVIQLGSADPEVGPSQAIFDHTAPRVLTSPSSAYLKVAEGCDNPCTFCAIPQWRGRFRSRSIESLVAEAQDLEAQGVPELCLVAQDTTRYGEDLGMGRDGLRRLVEALLAETQVPWIRFLYAYPATLDRGLLELMGREERFCSYLDIPLQHADRSVLKRMRRAGSAERYLDLVAEARELVPEIWLRTTFIVGFPGETTAEFDRLQAFIDRARFDHLGVFQYSPEDGTPGAQLEGRVPRPEMARRAEALLEVQRPISEARRRSLVGDTIEVLVEGPCEETDLLLQGRHRGMAPGIDGRVLINDGHARVGEIVPVGVTEAYADDIVGAIGVDGRVARAGSGLQSALETVST